MKYVERLLLVVAVVALGWYATARAGTMLYQAAQNRQLDEMRLERAESRADVASGAPASPSNPAPAPRRVLPGADAAPEPASPRTAEPRRPSSERAADDARGLIGRIEIPRLGVSAIVREGVDNRTLGRAVGHVPETARPGDAGNVAFAGHRDTFFSPLKRVRVGDRIRVSTPDGDFSYVVSETRVVAPDDVSVLAPTTEPALTLITCFPFNMAGPAPDRFIVRARAVR